MIRVLAMIAAAGLVVSAATLSAAVVIAGPDTIANGGWSFGPHGWGGHLSRHVRDADDGPQTSRDIAWTGTDSLDIAVDAEVTYTQAPGAPKLTISGPKNALDDIVVDNGHIRYREDHDHDAHLVITVSAPAVSRFTVEDSGSLSLVNYSQDDLTLAVEGSAEVKAAGQAKAVDVSIEGSGSADLTALKTASAKVTIEGSGGVTAGPSEAAELKIEGSGDITLLTNPPKLRTTIEGSGQVRQNGRTVAGE